eukprot:1186633-Prorocentrum_minimum.AAC.2
MIPHKTKRGASALERFKAFEGVPPPYDKVKRAVIPDALNFVRVKVADVGARITRPFRLQPSAPLRAATACTMCIIDPARTRVLRLQTSHKFCTLGKLAAEVGWKHGPTVATLEEKRLTRSADYYKLKKKGVQVALKAKTAAASQLKGLQATLAPVGMA